MKFMRWLIFITGMMLIVVRGFWSDVFMVDAFTILILFILSIPFIAQYLRKAKFAGAEFEFKDEMNKQQNLRVLARRRFYRLKLSSYLL